MNVVVCADLEAVAARAAEHVVEVAGAAIAARGAFALALAGGSTPRALHAELVRRRSALDWPRAELYFGDERAVPPDDPASNYAMARETLIEPLGIDAERVHRLEGESADLDRAARRYEGTLKAGLGASDAEGVPGFDLMLLGLGADAHTASLFPRTAALWERRRLVVANSAPASGAHRLTATLPLINAARAVLFVLAGAEKAQALARVVEGEHDVSLWPAQAVAPRSGALSWIVDEAAAAGLSAAFRAAHVDA